MHGSLRQLKGISVPLENLFSCFETTENRVAAPFGCQVDIKPADLFVTHRSNRRPQRRGNELRAKTNAEHWLIEGNCRLDPFHLLFEMPVGVCLIDTHRP